MLEDHLQVHNQKDQPHDSSRRFDDPYTVIGHVHGRQDLLRLRHKFTEDELRTVNIEKIIVVLDEFSEEAASHLRNYEDQPTTTQAVTPPPPPLHNYLPIRAQRLILIWQS